MGFIEVARRVGELFSRDHAYRGPLEGATIIERSGDGVSVAGLSVGQIAGSARQRNESKLWRSRSNADMIFVSGMGFGVLDGRGRYGAFYSQSAENLLLIVVKWILEGEPAEDLLQEVAKEIAIAAPGIRDGLKIPNDPIGTTATIGAIVQNGEKRQLLVAHIGNSRAYLLRGENFSLLTKDDNSKYLGKEGENGKFDIQIHGIEEGDIYLFCTYGVSSRVEKEKIQQILSSAKTPKEKAEELVRLGVRNDDASAVVVQIGPEPVASIASQ